VRAQFSNPFVWPGYDQVAWVQLQRYEERPWTELVDLWRVAQEGDEVDEAFGGIRPAGDAASCPRRLGSAGTALHAKLHIRSDQF
jgi:hypothetical protein